MFKLIERPVKIPIDNYDNLIDKLVNQLKKDNSIHSIFQVGSIKDPGISDLDLFCVFNNGSQNKKDYRGSLSSAEKQILTHNIFALSIKDAPKWLLYNQLSNYRLLHGCQNIFESSNGIKLDNEIKYQIALEYLLKMYIALHVQITYGIVKLRSFLLEAKAIAFDLELLGINSGSLHDMVCQIIKIRNEWYAADITDQKLCQLFIKFFKELEDLLIEQLATFNFNLPNNEIFLSNNLKLSRGSRLKKSHYGYVFHKNLSFFGRKYFNLLNRFNNFEYEVNFSVPPNGSKISKRFLLNKKIYMKNLVSFPHFIAPISSLRLFYKLNEF